MIIRDPNYIEIKPDGRELLEAELNKDGFVVNQGDVSHYLMNRIDPHWHDELELFVLDSGEVEVELNGKHFLFSKGEGCFVNQDVLHSFEAKTKEAKFRSFVFQPSFVSGMTGSVFDLNYISPLLNSGVPFLVFERKNSSLYFEAFDTAFQACVQEKSGYEFQLRNALSQIVLYCLQRKEASGKIENHRINQRVKSMMLWIDEHLEDEIEIAMIAEHSGLCARECQRCFEKVLSTSPMEYVRQKRIVKAAQLLQQTEMPIVEIAYRLHFASSSHFSKVFREMTGCTPMQYRKKMKDYN